MALILSLPQGALSLGFVFAFLIFSWGAFQRLQEAATTRRRRVEKKSAKKVDPTDLVAIFFEGVILQLFWGAAPLLLLVVGVVAAYKLFTLVGFLKTVGITILMVFGTFYFWFIFLKDRPNGGGGHGGKGGHH